MKTFLMVMMAAGIGLCGCEKPPAARAPSRPRHLAPEGVYYLISAKKLPPALAALKLKSGAQLVHIGDDEYQAGEHRIRLAPDLVTNDNRIRDQILDGVRDAEEEERRLKEEQAEQERLARVAKEQAERERLARAAITPRATPVSPLSQGAYDQRRQVRPPGGRTYYTDSYGRRVYY